MSLVTIGGLWRPEAGKTYTAQGNLDLKAWTGKDGVERDSRKVLLEALMSGDEKISVMIFPNKHKQPGSKQPDFNLVLALKDEEKPVQTQAQEYPLPPVDEINVEEIPF